MQRLWKFFSGFGLATTLLVILGIQTWLATLEMVDAGLLATLQKYFHWSSWYVLAKAPVFGSDLKLIIPMPGGYWVCALLMVNMILGGLIRARKGWKTIGVLMSHFAIIFMIAAGGVAQVFEKRGVMILFEGDQSDYAVSLTDPTIEVLELDGGQATGMVTVVGEPELRGLEPSDVRRVILPDQPFDLELTGWLPNVAVRPASGSQSSNPVVDGWRLLDLPVEKEGELNSPGCYARAIFADGSKGDAFIMAVPPSGFIKGTFPPQVVEAEGRRFAVRLAKETIPVPFPIQLDDAIAEYFPNSMKPKSFMSKIQRIEDGEQIKVDISMNEPMRRGGFTFFQRTMSGGPQAAGAPEYSGLEVVSNPADKWPEYSLYMVAVGLFIHFVTKLWIFLLGSSRKPSKA
ncbi:cytochrome c biogenesis protein ResB [Haloferula rosea]|uniref:Cytochrome c biogenesis protein ResB n=1 Tax=Haloferula rosea TaxID=490093 RepID=A0A934RC51_9BACT|nr:cytochrome c biogenesis protein ResB [Haloferula rosea]MBK1825906.1 cytochrome c biogenesis protein ResB [Haloferula rosea]